MVQRPVGDPRNKATWTVANAWPYTRIPADYAIVTRVPKRDHGTNES